MPGLAMGMRVPCTCIPMDGSGTPSQSPDFPIHSSAWRVQGLGPSSHSLLLASAHPFLCSCAPPPAQVQYPDSLGQMELRIGLHIGPVYAGVLVSGRRLCGMTTA